MAYYWTSSYKSSNDKSSDAVAVRIGAGMKMYFSKTIPMSKLRIPTRNLSFGIRVVKKWLSMNVSALCMVTSALSCSSGSNHTDSYKFLDHNLPKKRPEIFAEGIVSKSGRYEQYCSFSQDGHEMYISITDKEWNYVGMLYSTFENGQWTKPDTVHFARGTNDGGEPFAYGNSLYFVSVRHHENPWHTDIYEATRNGSLQTQLKRLSGPINSSDNEWHPTFSEKGTMYFGSERNNERYVADIYKSELVNGIYVDAVKLQDSINTEFNDCDPLIAPDESFLIFHSDRPGGFGEHDLYISFRKENTSWTLPKNMGSFINSPEWELGPSLSPDGKFLFFTRRKAFQTDTPSKVYWVSTSVLEDLK